MFLFVNSEKAPTAHSDGRRETRSRGSAAVRGREVVGPPPDRAVPPQRTTVIRRVATSPPACKRTT